MSRLGAVGLALCLSLTGCGTPGPDDRPRYHTVRGGETIWRISQDYGTTVDELVHANAIRDVNDVRVGTRLFIPPSRGYVRRDDANSYNGSHSKGKSGSMALSWPLEGRLSSRYGLRGQAHHDGIDIKAPPGTPIRAAEAGRVIHSDNSLAGYGNMVIIKHPGSFSSVYAHNRRNLVQVGDFVEKGQVIAEVGQTGRASTPHLHFEVRRNGKARDPLQYLR